MTVQPLAPPATDLEILEALDFEPTVPCEAKGHKGDAPAAYLVGMRSHYCRPIGPDACCEPCWERLALPPNHFHCGYCDAHTGTRDQSFMIVCTLGGGS